MSTNAGRTTAEQRKLILKMSVSIDGFVGGPNGEIEWIFGSLDDAAAAWTVETLWQAGVHAMGSVTFRDMSAYWPTSTEPFAPPMNEIPKVVFSRTGLGDEELSTAFRDASHRRAVEGGAPSPAGSSGASTWAEAAVLSGDLADEIARLKQAPGKDILAHGGARFAQSLVQLDVVDEYRLLVHPVALGRGLPLFSGLSTPLALKLDSTTSFPAGAVAQVYRRG